MRSKIRSPGQEDLLRAFSETETSTVGLNSKMRSCNGVCGGGRGGAECVAEAQVHVLVGLFLLERINGVIDHRSRGVDELAIGVNERPS